MRKFIIIVLVVFFNNNGWSQKSGFDYLTDTINMPVAKGVREYYNYINKAKNEIIKGNYNIAKDFYIEAFHYKLPFREDVNTFKALVKETKSKDSLTILTDLIYRKKYFGSDSLLIKYSIDNPEVLKQPFWKNVPQILDSIKVLDLNGELVQKISLMVEKDQNIRNECNSKYGNTWVGTPCWEKVKNIDSLNLVSLLNLFKNNKNNYDYNNSQMYVLFLHYCRRAWGEWIPFLLRMTREGYINNQTIADLLDQYQTSYKSFYKKDDLNTKEFIFAYNSNYALFDKFIVLKLTETEKQEINKIRRSFFLEPYDDTKKIKAWTVEQRMYNLEEPFNLTFIWSFGITKYVGITKEEIGDGEKQQEQILKDENTIKNYEIIDLKRTLK
jgi:hypothetical protein